MERRAAVAITEVAPALLRRLLFLALLVLGFWLLAGTVAAHADGADGRGNGSSSIPGHAGEALRGVTSAGPEHSQRPDAGPRTAERASEVIGQVGPVAQKAAEPARDVSAETRNRVSSVRDELADVVSAAASGVERTVETVREVIGSARPPSVPREESATGQGESATGSSSLAARERGPHDMVLPLQSVERGELRATFEEPSAVTSTKTADRGQQASPMDSTPLPACSKGISVSGMSAPISSVAAVSWSSVTPASGAGKGDEVEDACSDTAFPPGSSPD
jgi:hypothetical protein